MKHESVLPDGCVSVSDELYGEPQGTIQLWVGEDEWSFGHAKLTPDQAEEIAEALTDAAEAVRERNRPPAVERPKTAMDAITDDGARMVVDSMVTACALDWLDKPNKEPK